MIKVCIVDGDGNLRRQICQILDAQNENYNIVDDTSSLANNEEAVCVINLDDSIPHLIPSLPRLMPFDDEKRTRELPKPQYRADGKLKNRGKFKNLY